MSGPGPGGDCGSSARGRGTSSPYSETVTDEQQPQAFDAADQGTESHAVRAGATPASAAAEEDSSSGAAGPTAGGGQGAFFPEGYEPTRSDRLCLTLVALSGIYMFGVMFARPVLLGFNPIVLAGLSGSRSALVTIGALHATGAMSLGWVVFAWVVATLSLIKLDLLFWWAGHLWGDFFITQLVGDSRRRAKQAARAESWARRYTTPVILVANIPVLPVPKGLVFAVLGTSETTFRKIFWVDLLVAAAVQALWLYLGFTIGEPVVQIVEVIAKYSLWLTLAIVAFTVGAAWWNGRNQTRVRD